MKLYHRSNQPVGKPQIIAAGLPKFLLPFAFLALCACDSSTDTLALAYAELRVAMHEYGETEDGKVIRLQILEKYGLSANSFEERTEELKKEPDKWIKFQKTVINILDSIARLDSIAKLDSIIKLDTIAK